MAELLEAEHLR